MVVEDQQAKVQQHSLHKTVSKLRSVRILLRRIHLIVEPLSVGRVVTLNSGCCVLQGALELKKGGAHAGAVIKRQQRWPRHVGGQVMNEQVARKSARECDQQVGD